MPPETAMFRLVGNWRHSVSRLLRAALLSGGVLVCWLLFGGVAHAAEVSVPPVIQVVTGVAQPVESAVRPVDQVVRQDVVPVVRAVPVRQVRDQVRRTVGIVRDTVAPVLRPVVSLVTGMATGAVPGAVPAAVPLPHRLPAVPILPGVPVVGGGSPGVVPSRHAVAPVVPRGATVSVPVSRPAGRFAGGVGHAVPVPTARPVPAPSPLPAPVPLPGPGPAPGQSAGQRGAPDRVSGVLDAMPRAPHGTGAQISRWATKPTGFPGGRPPVSPD